MINVLKILLGLGLLAYLFFQVPITDLLDAFVSAKIEWILVAIAVSFLTMFCSITKLYFLLAHDSNLSYPNAVNAYYVGTFFNNFLPTSIGGDLVKVYEINRNSKSDVTLGGSAVFVERASGIVVLLGLAGLLSILEPSIFHQLGVGLLNDGRIWLVSFLVAAGLILVLQGLVPEDDEYSSSIFELASELNRPLKDLKLGIVILGLSVVFHLFRALNFVLMGYALDVHVGYLESLALLPVIAFITFLPVSFGGIGIREGVVTYCFSGIGLAYETAFAIALIFRGFTALHSLIGGGIYLRSRGGGI